MLHRKLILIEGKEYNLNIYLERRNSSRASIGRTGINLRIPLNLSREEQQKQIITLKQWAIKKIKEKPLQVKDKGQNTYNSEDIINVMGQEYKISITSLPIKVNSARLLDSTIIFKINQDLDENKKRKVISILLSRVLSRHHLPYVQSRISYLNQNHFNFNPKKIFLKYNTSNWGSCSHKGNINLSSRLLFAPKEVIDYVCIHELAHLKEKNHSKEFWGLVKQAMPDYKEKKKWLRENSDLCWF